MNDCIFCRIISGDIPSYKVYEDDHVLAFLDISQVTLGHTLIVPKEHVTNVYEWSPKMGEQIGRVIPKIAKALQKATPTASGLNIINNNGEVAYQSVFHSHIHLIPRYSKEDGLNITFGSNTHEPELMASLAQTINDYTKE